VLLRRARIEPRLVIDGETTVDPRPACELGLDALLAQNVEGTIEPTVKKMKPVPGGPTHDALGIGFGDGRLCDARKTIGEPLSESVVLDVIVGEERLFLVRLMVEGQDFVTEHDGVPAVAVDDC